MHRCFVIIQPFDGGKFDKRFDDVLAPAIEAADIEPYRVDRDPSVTIPIEDIQSGIESSRACLADITTDNPNVWFELGFAIASQREVVLICSDERTTNFPFDVQHRHIIKYATESPSDFDQLREKITTRLKAALQKEGQLHSLVQMTASSTIGGLKQYEIATLVAVAQNLTDPTGGTSHHLIQQDMEKAGFAKIATTLGVRGLIEKKMLDTFEEHGYNEVYTVFRVRDEGMAWLYKNTDQLNLKYEPPKKLRDDFKILSDDEVPF